VKQYYLMLIGGKKEADIVAWANGLAAGKVSEIKDFKDKSLSDGLMMLHTTAAIESRCVNWDLVMKGESDEEK
jgi:plastin-1